MIIMGPFSENLETLKEQQLISIPREDQFSNRKRKAFHAKWFLYRASSTLQLKKGKSYFSFQSTTATTIKVTTKTLAIS
jgi:hypothetical protein